MTRSVIAVGVSLCVLPGLCALGAGTSKPAAATTSRPATQTATRIPLAQLSDADVVNEYRLAGLALEGTEFVPMDIPISTTILDTATDPRAIRFRDARREILRRGKQTTPELMGFLIDEVPVVRPRQSTGHSAGFTRDILELMACIDDPRPAGLVCQILEGFDRRATTIQRKLALETLESLTKCSFRKVRPQSPAALIAVQHPAAIDQDYFADLDQAAQLYRSWFNGDGDDSSQWTVLAQKRAHTYVASDDLEQVYCAAIFLQYHADPDRAATVKRLGELISGMTRGAEDYLYVYNGKEIPVSIGNWERLLTFYGPRARAFAPTLIRLHREGGLNDFAGYGSLAAVGGPEILSFLFESLPQISKQADAVRGSIRPGQRPDPNNRRHAWLLAEHECRAAIDRWIGQNFATDAQRQTAWQASKDQSDEQRLRAGLGQLATRVDLQDPDAILLMSRIVKAPMPKSGCAAWIKANLPGLRYDADSGTFLPAH